MRAVGCDCIWNTSKVRFRTHSFTTKKGSSSVMSIDSRQVYPSIQAGRRCKGAVGESTTKHLSSNHDTQCQSSIVCRRIRLQTKILRVILRFYKILGLPRTHTPPLRLLSVCLPPFPSSSTSYP